MVYLSIGKKENIMIEWCLWMIFVALLLCAWHLADIATSLKILANKVGSEEDE